MDYTTTISFYFKLKLYREEVNKEMQKVKAGQSESVSKIKI